MPASDNPAPAAAAPETSVYELIAVQARRNPDALAVLASNRRPLSYGQLLAHIEQTVSNLRGLGIGRQDRVAMVMPAWPETPVAFLSAAAGAVAAPLNPALPAPEMEWQLGNMQPAALMVRAGTDSPAAALAGSLGIPLIELQPIPEAEAGRFTLDGDSFQPIDQHIEYGQDTDTALVLHSSGTTARPKLVPITHRMLCTGAQFARQWMKLTPADRCLNIAPLFHTTGLVRSLLVPLSAGSSVACMPGFAPYRFLDWLEEFCPSWYSAAPAIQRAVLQIARQHPSTTAFSSLRFVFSSAAPLPTRLQADFERVVGVPLIDAYGLTEVVPQLTSNPQPPGCRKPGSVGLPAGPQLAIMDEGGNPLPPGQIGEVVVHGPNVTPGYLNAPGANQEAFRDGWFRTGDLGYFDQDGYLFLTGRVKEIINRGGEKISPREIDEILQQHPAVSQAGAFAVPHPTLGEDLAAAVVPVEPGAASEGELRQFLAERLVAFKVPQRIVFVEDLPRTASGKLKRVGLAEELGLTGQPGPVQVSDDVSRVGSPVQKLVADIWCEVLELNQIGLHQDFAQLGGESIRAAQVLEKIRQRVGIDLKLADFFETPTVAGLSNQIEAALLDKQRQSSPGMPRRDSSQPPPLSFGQHRLWFLDQLEPGSAVYNMLRALRIQGPLDVEILRRSLETIVTRHHTLRSNFLADAQGEPYQQLAGSWALEVPLLDLSARPVGERDQALQELMEECAQSPFDLTKDLMLRAKLYRMAPDEHVLLLVIHHIVCDFWSVGLLAQEMVTLYGAYQNGDPSPLAALPIQYADYAVWQRQQLQSETLQREMTFWQSQLRDSPPPLQLPADRPGTAAASYLGSRESLQLTPTLTEKLRQLSRQEKATLSMSCLAGFAALLYRYTGQDDFLIGLPITDRSQPETARLIGFFVNTLVFRASFAGDLSFRQLLTRVRQTSLQIFDHRQLPFDKLVEIAQPDRDLTRNPLFQVAFDYLGAPPPQPEIPGLMLSSTPVTNQHSVFDLTLFVGEDGGVLNLAVDYRTDLFQADIITRMLDHLQTLLEAAAAHPDQAVATLPLLTGLERSQILVDWNNRSRPFPDDQTIAQLFEAQVERAPDALAVTSLHPTPEHGPASAGGSSPASLTYRQLNSRANQLAHALIEQGAGPDVPVGIHMRRSPLTVMALLGVLKAGAAYLPLDPDYPPQRIRYMVEDANVKTILSQAPLLDGLKGLEAEVLCLDQDWERLDRLPEGNPIRQGSAGDLAYIMYTSGSTGRPKGVAIPQQAVTSLVINTDYTKLGPRDVVAQASTITFDAATFEIWGALLNGARLLILPHQTLLSPSDLLAQLEAQGVTTLFVTTSLFNLIVSQQPDAFKSLKHLLFGGEMADLDRVRQLLDGHPPQRLLHVYGPTETTTFASWYDATGPGQNATNLPIGQPIANTRLYILDRHLQPLPAGLPGELFVGGPGLARGYLNDPDLTRAKFVPDPFGPEEGARLFRSGDLARFRSDGNIEFLGRLDDQVKIRGFRVEPGEVESALRQQAGVQQAAVLARTETGGTRQLAAFVVPHTPDAVNGPELRKILTGILPDAMIPASITVLEELPLTATGKLDRQALLGLDPEYTAIGEGYVGPRTVLEQELATIWSEALGAERVGIRDNFFDLGGHSLLAVRIFARIEQVTGQKLPLSVLFQAPTVEQLAAVVESSAAQGRQPSVVAVQPEGSQPALFLVPPAVGTPLSFTRLAHYMGTGRPIFAFDPMGVRDKAEFEHRIEDMAGHYVEQMLELPISGPYLLGGMCFGGHVALEMAQILHQMGKQPALLVVLDVIPPASGPSWTPQTKGVAHYLDQGKNLGVKWSMRVFTDRARRKLRFLSRSLHQEGREFEQLHRLHSQALASYSAREYPGRIALFQSESSARRGYIRARWTELAGGGLEHYVIPDTTHRDLLLNDHYIQRLAEQIKSCLDHRAFD